MGTKYSTTTSSGYNSGAPADDGSAVPSNEIKWATIKTKLADVLKTFIEAVDTKLVTASDVGVDDKSVNYTTDADDHLKTMNVTAAITISLGDASTIGASYIVTVKNSHTAVITVDLATATDALDGTVNGSVDLAPNQAATFITNAAANGYFQLSTSGGNRIAETSDHRFTPAAGFGEFWVKDDSPNSPYFTDDAGNDIELAGRTATASNHVRAGDKQLIEGSQTITGFNVNAAMVESTFESVGPTGSGATNIVADMDDMPSNARIALFDVFIDYEDDGSAGDSSASLFATSNDVASPTASRVNNGIAESRSGAGIGIPDGFLVRVEIPVDSNQVFKVTWQENNTQNLGILLYYRGFIAD